MDNAVTFEEVLQSAKRLSLVDKVRLIEQIAPQIEREITATRPTPRQSFRGMWKGVDITERDIEEVRQEMWGNFPRENS